MSDEYNKGYQRGLEVGRNEASVFLQYENQRLRAERAAALAETEQAFEAFERQTDDVAILRSSLHEASIFQDDMNAKLAAARAELDATQKRCNEAYGNVSALFGEFVNISLMTHLGGEVDDYAAVTKAVRAIVDERGQLKHELEIMAGTLDQAEARMNELEANELVGRSTNEP